MFGTINRLYEKTHDKDVVRKAVEKKWISAEDYEKITGEKYE